MKIIAGQAKGRKLKTLEGRKIRPTSGRVKEALFNILSTIVVGKEILDLFAGTGSLGLEALSRGASGATFVDKDKDAFKILCSNIKLLEFEERSKTFFMDAFRAVKKFGREKKKYDIIFIDPPYGNNLYEKILIGLIDEEIVSKDGMIIVEHPSSKKLKDNYKCFIKVKSQKYGNTLISIYTKEGLNENSSICG